MANPLDWAARAILQLNGMSPEQIKAKARQIKKQGPKKPMPKANTSAPQPERKAPVTRRTRVQGRIRPGAVTRSSQAGQPKPVRQGPRTANVKQQVDIGPRSAQKPDGPIGPNSRYTPKSKQQPDGKAPSKNVRKLQEAARTKPKSAAPKPVPKITPKSTTKAGPGISSRPLGTADVGPKGEVGRLGQRTGMKGNSPKPQLNAPKPGVKASAPGSTQVKGQTNLFNAKGEPRDFRNPKVSANRPPTTTPIKHEASKQLNPKPQRPAAPGQGNLFDQKPAIKPQAAKPQKPVSSGKSVAPTVKGPVQRPGLAERAKTRGDLWPNSTKQNTNLPKEGAARLRSITQGPKAPTSKPTAKPAPKPVARNVMPNSRAKGINLPQAANNAVRPNAGPTLKGTKPGTRTAPKPPATQPVTPKVNASDAAAARAVRATNLGRRLSVGRGGLAQVALSIANAVDDSRLTPAQKAKKYEVVDPNRKDRVVDNLLSGGPRAKDSPKPKPATSKDAKAVQTKNYQRPQAQVNKPSSNKQATDKRDKKKLF